MLPLCYSLGKHFRITEMTDALPLISGDTIGKFNYYST